MGGKCIVSCIQWDNWTDFGDTGAHSAAMLISPFDVCHLECHAISPLTSTAVFVREAYGVTMQAGNQHFPLKLPSTRASLGL